jgi:ArsR family transcriptional regulator, arsenate/arsenite/antimonite-responsive transcriptional repressor
VLTVSNYFHYIGNMKTSEAVIALEALAQESRLGIFRLLVEAGPEGLPAGRIAERMKLPGPTLSFHLAQLKHAGLVACRREGTSLIYSAEFGAMDTLVGFMTENCCGGDAAQCAPARRVSGSKGKRRAA